MVSHLASHGDSRSGIGHRRGCSVVVGGGHGSWGCNGMSDCMSDSIGWGGSKASANDVAYSSAVAEPTVAESAVAKSAVAMSAVAKTAVAAVAESTDTVTDLAGHRGGHEAEEHEGLLQIEGASSRLVLTNI
ncbi:hypothetical protein HPB47_011847 [Ixodes persulcatus]|uniref:Uncharacterized protein n=1 Tax=Ixodes persulcatus TaxID=34615 RepID=A0AC60NV86_IXOPE|nr:hypothetical protein HPB47_011847 [Ixodes persulcatus]